MVRDLLPIFAAVGVATAAVQLTTTGCVDPSGLQTCLNGVTTTTTACLNQARVDNSQLETLACGCTDYVFRYNCYMAHCWNRVNECEYQGYIAEFLMLCPTAKRPVPYFPAPKGAPDACSCNLGDVLGAITDSITTGTSCTSNQNGGDAADNVQRIQGCQCCEVSSAISSIYGLCPSTDPTLIGLTDVQTLEKTLNTDLSGCTSYLSKYSCESDLGFPAVAGGTFYNADNLPASGTQTLSNGPGTVTAPASGAVFTYTNAADSQVYTISAAGYKDDGSNSGSGNSGSGNSGSGDSAPGNAASTTTGGSGSGGSGGSGASSPTGSAASPDSTGLAGRVSVRWGLLGAVLFVTSLVV